jgi:hypothetical protein
VDCVVVGYLYCLRFDRGVVHSAVVGYLYCLRFDRSGARCCGWLSLLFEV